MTHKRLRLPAGPPGSQEGSQEQDASGGSHTRVEKTEATAEGQATSHAIDHPPAARADNAALRLSDTRGTSPGHHTRRATQAHAQLGHPRHSAESDTKHAPTVTSTGLSMYTTRGHTKPARQSALSQAKPAPPQRPTPELTPQRRQQQQYPPCNKRLILPDPPRARPMSPDKRLPQTRA
jgi:hypothetical protein